MTLAGGQDAESMDLLQDAFEKRAGLGRRPGRAAAGHIEVAQLDMQRRSGLANETIPWRTGGDGSG